MPAHVHPQQAALHATLSDNQVQLALGASGPVLTQAYQRAVKALGVKCEGVNVLAVHGDLPEGLKALINRHNPDLAAAIGHDSGIRFVYKTPSASALDLLATSDRQALGWLVEQGLLQAAPGLTIVDSGQGGLTRIVSGTPVHAQISMDVDIRASMSSPTLPFSDRVDPVLFRWLTLFHEAGHAQRAMENQAFELPQSNPKSVKVLNELLMGPTTYTDPLAQTFDESYADTFAVLVLLRLTHASPASWDVVKYFQNARKDAQAHPVQGGFDPHAASAGLDRLIADLRGNPSRQKELQSASPAQIRQWARRYASWSATQWASHRDQEANPSFGWTLVVPDSTETPENQELLRTVFFQVQDAKLTAYVRARISAYVSQAPGHALSGPATDGDPLLQSLAAQDAHFHAVFNARGSQHGHEVALKILNAPPFGGSGQDEIDRAFEALPEVAAVLTLMREAAGHFLDHQKSLDQESVFQSNRGKLAMQALKHPQSVTPLWEGPPAPLLASVRRMRH